MTKAQRKWAKEERRREHAKTAGEDYASRQHWLRELEFPTYTAYLQSPVWKRVKAKVHRRKGWKCHACQGFGAQVHHLRYHKNDLLGRTLKYLVPICGKCHQTVEFTNKGGKKPLSGANGKLAALSRPDETGCSPLHRSRLIHEELDAQFDAICRNL